jgi:hypothetical protein
LAELLIATGITVLIVVMLGWMLGSLMSSATHTTQRVDAFRDARAALQMMERDLSNLIRTQWTPDPFSSPTPTPGTAQPLTVPTAYFALDNTLYADPAAGNQQLYALVAAKTTASSGDVCAVGYYCRWDTDQNGSRGRYTLRRFFRALTLSDMQGFGTYAGESVLYTPGLSDPVLAANVWNLKITMYDSGGAVITQNSYICDPNASTPNPLPAAIEISFNAMSPDAARTVMSISNVTAADWMNAALVPIPSPTPNYQGLILPHTYQFRTRINF